MTTPDSTSMKRCTKCGELKPSTAFYAHSGHSDGLRCDCKACVRARARKHYTENRDVILDRTRQCRAANPEPHRAASRAYYRKNKDRCLAGSARWARDNHAVSLAHKRKWQHENPEKLRENKHRRRARVRNAPGSFTSADLAAVRAAQTDKQGRLICWACGKPIKGTPHLDHWIPLDKAGSNDPGNLHYMHARCNLTKSAKHPAELGRLI